jgi:hypothetical protein
MQQLFDICTEILQTKKQIYKTETQGDYIRFTQHVQRRNLENAEYELKERLREILRTEGEARFKEVVAECEKYMQHGETKEENKPIEISYYKNVLEKQSTPVLLSKFLFSTKHAQSIDNLRKLATKKDIDDAKALMPCATMSGTFGAHTAAALISYNGIACLDFDGKDNPSLTPEGMKAILSNMKEVYYAGLSIGGKGIFAIIKTDNKNPERHFSMMESLGEMFKNFGINYDKSGKDVNRLRYISYDKSPYFNEDAEILKANVLPQKEVKQLAPRIYTPYEQGTTRSKIDKCIDQIESQGIDMTTDYADWISLGFSLASELGYDGEDYFLRVSQYHPKFDPNKTSKKYDNLKKHCKSGSIGVFFNICKKYGIDIK